MNKILISLCIFGGLLAVPANTIILNIAKDSFTKEYSVAEGHKAFAQSPGGTWSWYAGSKNIESARQGALARCNTYLSEHDKPCVVINEDGKWVKK